MFAFGLAGCDDEPESNAQGDPATTEQPVEEPLVPTPPPPPTRPGPTCTYHGWCWHSPFPQGNTLHDVHAIRTDLVFAVGARGTVLRYDGTAWAFEDTPTRELLRGVGGASAESLWAVGDRGTLIHRVNDEWLAVDARVESTLRAVWARADDDAYVVGVGGVVLHWDGEAWTQESVPTNLALVDVIGNDVAVYALAADTTESAVLYVRTDAGWVEEAQLGNDVAAMTLEGTSIVVAGLDARRRDLGGTFRRERLRGQRPVNALFTNAAGTTIAVGYDGRIETHTGDRWSTQTIESEPDLLAVSGAAPDDIWAVGEHGALVHFNGAWARVSAGSTRDLYGVYGRSADDIWAVGDDATLHFDGTRWSDVEGNHGDLRAVWGSGTNLWAAGTNGAVLTEASGSWTELVGASDVELTGIWGASPERVFVVGKSMWVEQTEGIWGEAPERPSSNGVWGTSASDVWSVGRDGLHHFDGTGWSPVDSTRGMILFGVFGFAHDDVWAVGAGGRVLHHDGSSWSPIDVPSEQNLLAVWGSTPDNVVVVGHHGTILRYDGESWAWRDSGTDATLRGVWGDGQRVYVVGRGGTILRNTEPPG